MGTGDSPGGRQPQSRAAGLGGEERREELWHGGGGNSGTRIHDVKMDGAAVPLDHDGDLTTVVHRMQGIEQKVLQRDLQQLGIRQHELGIPGHAALHPAPGRVHAEKRDQAPDECRDIQKLQVRLRGPRVQQQVGHHRAQRVETAERLVDDLVIFVRRQLFTEDLHRGTHGRQRIPDLVRKHGRQLSDARQGGFFAQLPLQFHLLGQVTDDAREFGFSFHRNGAHRQVRGKQPAILASRGHIAADSDDVWHAGAQVSVDVPVVGRRVRLRHQDRHVPAHDLIGRIAEHPFGGWIEEFDCSATVDHDDAVHGRLDNGAPARSFLLRQVGVVPLHCGRHLVRGRRHRQCRHRGILLSTRHRPVTVVPVISRVWNVPCRRSPCRCPRKVVVATHS